MPHADPAKRRERIRAQVRSSRRAQGLGPHITDTAVLDRLAGRVLDQAAELTDPAEATGEVAV